MYVYVLRQTGNSLIKIGVSTDLDKRISDLRAASPYDLEMVYTLTCSDRSSALAVEQLLHQRYKANRMAGEWFDIPYSQVIDDLDWCIAMGNLIAGGTQYFKTHIYEKSPKTPGIKPKRVGNAASLVVKWLNEHPEDERLSQNALAKRIGVSVGTVNAVFKTRSIEQPIEHSSNGHRKE